MKKFGKLFFAAVISLSLVACGGGSTSSADASKVLKVSVEATYVPFVESIKEEFEKENGVTLEVTARPMFETLDGLALEGPSGSAADVFMLAHDRIGPLVVSGQLAPVTLDNKADYADKAVQAATFEDKTYIAPSSVEALILYYNKDLLPEAPTSFSTLEDLAKNPKFDFAGETGKSVAFLTDFINVYYAYGVIAAPGGYAFGKDGTDPTDVGLNNAGAIKGLDYIKSWYNVFPQGMKDTETAPSIIKDSFNSGKTAAIIDGPWVAKDLSIENLGYAVIPTLPTGEEVTPFAGVKGWGVSNFSTNKDVANKWVNYVTNKDNSKKFHEASKEIPANKSVLTEIKASDDLLSGTVAKQFEASEPMPNIPEMSAIWEFKGTIFEIVSGADTKTAADAGVNTIKEAIAA